MAQRLLHRLLFTIFFWQSQWHSDYYTDFFWQSFLTTQMAQRLLHRLLLTKMLHELLPDRKKTIKIKQGHKVSTKKNQTQTSAKPTKYCAQQQKWCMNYCRIWKKSSKHCGHTGWIRRHKDCKWKLKINKVLRTTAKMIHELVLHTSKSHQNIAGTQANYESTKYSNEKSKSNKVLRTTAKMMHELLPDRKKVMETLRARRMIRLLPERYDLNRPLVLKQFILTAGVSSCQPCQSCSVLIRFSSCLKESVPFDKTKELTPMSCAIGVAAVYKWVKQLVGLGSANDLIMSFNSSMSIKTRIWGLLVRVMVCTVERAEVQSVFCACCGNEDVPNTCAYRLIFLTYLPGPWHPSRLAANAPPVPRKPGE